MIPSSMRLVDYKGKKYTEQQLKDKQKNYITTMDSILTKAVLEKRALNDNEVVDYERLTNKLADLDAFMDAMRAPVNAPFYTPLYQDPPQEESPDQSGPAKDRTFRGMFHNSRIISLDRGEFKNFNDFLSVIDSGRYDPRLQVRNAMMEGTGSTGGFAVPEEFAAWLLDTSLENEIVRSRATIWPMTSNVRNVPAWDGQDHTSSLFGGFTGTWLGEGSTATRQNAKLRLLELKAEKLAIFTQASRELVADGLDFEAQLGNALVSALGWYMDDAFINGNGVGRPRGILNDPALVTVAKEAGQPADTIMYENCTKMFARLHPTCIENAVWIVNQTAMPQLLTMCIAVGTGGAFIPAVVQNNGQMTLMGKPVLFTEKCPVLGDKGDIVLADLSKYAIGMRQDLIIDKSNAPGWLEDMQDYRVIARVNGTGTWDKPVTPAKGNTLSWCVTLAERA